MRCVLAQRRSVLSVAVLAIVLTFCLNSSALAQATSFDIYGYRANEGGGGALDVKWTKGNLGNTWSEGEWVPYKLVITNIQTDFPNFVDFPDLTLSYDFASKGNRFVDLVRSLQISTLDLNDTQGWVNDAGNAYPLLVRQDIEDAQNDVGNAPPFENAWNGFELLKDAAPVNFGSQIENLINRDLALGDGTPTDERHTITVPTAAILEYLSNEGLPTSVDTIVLYFQLHESRSFIWQNTLQAGYDAPPSDEWGGYLYSLPSYAADARTGSGYVPGSSGHIHLESVSGSKDVPIPIPERLPGAVSGLKWLDKNGDGIYDMGAEPTLSGWRIYVEGTLEGIFFQTSQLTDEFGNYSFPNLTSNVTWIISEAEDREVPAESGYMQTAPQPGDIEGVGTGVILTPGPGIADWGWSVPLTVLVPDQGDLNFGNMLCQPEITCPPLVTIECDESTDPSNTGEPVVDVNCGPYTVNYFDSETPGSCPQEYTITRLWVVTDAAGVADSCEQTIEVVDTTPPLVSCPPTLTVQCIEDVPAPNPSLVEATDNCGALTVTFEGDVSDGGTCPETITRTYRATDECGNFAECTQTIIIDDTTPPSITCPPTLTVQCIEDVPAPNPSLVEATDNCGALTVTFEGDVSDGQTCPETITRTYRATDDCGNFAECTQTITVDDQTKPVLSGCPSDTTISCDEAVPAPASVVATDNCGPASLNYSELFIDGSCAQEYSIERKWVASDACGNLDSCVQTIYVVDTTAPTLVCAADDRIPCDGTPFFTEPTPSDKCDLSPSVVMVRDTSYDGPAVGEVTWERAWIAVDDCGNESDTCSQRVIEEACPDFCTFTIGGWGTNCSESQQGDMYSTHPGCVRDHYFDLVFPGGEVVIGDASGYTVTFTSSAAIAAFLPNGSTPGMLNQNYVDPYTTSAGVLAAQVLALTLNVEYSCAGVFGDLGLTPAGFCYSEQSIPDSCGSEFSGMTVGEFLALANLVISGNASVLDPYGVSVGDVAHTAACLNERYSECDPYAIFYTAPVVDDGRDARTSQAAADGESDESGLMLPNEFGLSQNYPNPFNPVTSIEFALPQSATVQLEIFNVRGQLVTTLVNGQLEAGYHTVTWDASRAASGVYFYRIDAGDFVETKKMLLLK